MSKRCILCGVSQEEAAHPELACPSDDETPHLWVETINSEDDMAKMSIEEYTGIKHSELTGFEETSLEMIRGATNFLTADELRGSLSDVITSLGVAIAHEMRRAATDRMDAFKEDMMAYRDSFRLGRQASALAYGDLTTAEMAAVDRITTFVGQKFPEFRWIMLKSVLKTASVAIVIEMRRAADEKVAKLKETVGADETGHARQQSERMAKKKPTKTRKHPMQNVELDKGGLPRFVDNAIVRYLLDKGGVDMNEIAGLDFDQEDRQQFAQLIGYSVSGFGELSYVDDETYEEAVTKADAIKKG